MRRHLNRTMLLLTALALAAGACSNAGGETTTTTTLLVADTTTTTAPPATTVTAALPGGPPMIAESERSDTVAAFQWLIVCNGYADLTVDGNYGPSTGDAIRAAQTALGKVANGTPDEETFAELSRTCSQARELVEAVAMVGNADPTDPEVFTIDLEFDSAITVSVTPADGLTVTVRGIDGIPIDPDPETPGRWVIATTGSYEVMVAASLEPTTFTLTFEVGDALGDPDWIINTRSVTYKGTRLGLGDDADEVIEQIFDFLGHGIRGEYDEFDTGWYTITDPVNNGLRGIKVGGFAFLFWGPDPANPDRPETLARIRFEGANPDGEGNERPANYVTTPLGITVGHTLGDLKTAYGTTVSAGSNANEHWYRYTEAGGELCFYFGSGTPTDASEIVEIATECRR